ncbi:MAG: hypothetical protein K2H72_08465 [Muribaculaceae bacterium]|nr:hypothetical protein [Muribaculaceae bacterium]
MSTIRKKIFRVPRAPRVSSGIRLEGAASTVNQEMLAGGEWYPDRTLTPLVLQPFVSYTDATTGKHVDNALPEVTDGDWYRLDESNRLLGICDATKISMSSTGTDSNGNVITVFSIDSTPGSPTYGRLTVRENVPAGTEVTYIFEATLSTDGRLIREFFSSRCDSITQIPDIEFDNNPTALYDPLHGEQYFTINPSLSINYPVTWKWMSYHELEGGWVTLGSTQLDWAIDKVGNGIRIDRKRMQDMIMLRCVAEVSIDGSTVEIERVVSHTRMLPHIEHDITRIGELPEDVTTISPYADIKSGSEHITDTSEIAVEWLNSSGSVIAQGINPTFPLSLLNADMLLHLRVRDLGGYAALIDDGKLIMDGNALIITRSK